MAWLLSFRGHQSFIITRIHQAILVITDYRQLVMWRDQGSTHMHTLPSDRLSYQESETHLHIRRFETCSLTRPPFTEVLLNTLWNYKKFKSALPAVAGTQ